MESSAPDPNTQPAVHVDAAKLDALCSAAREIEQQIADPGHHATVLRKWVADKCSDETQIPGLGQDLQDLIESPRAEDFDLVVRWLEQAARLDAPTAATIVFDSLAIEAGWKSEPVKMALLAKAVGDLETPTRHRTLDITLADGVTSKVFDPSLTAALMIMRARGLRVLREMGDARPYYDHVPYAGRYLYSDSPGPINLVQMALLNEPSKVLVPGDIFDSSVTDLGGRISQRFTTSDTLLQLSCALSLMDVRSPAVATELARVVLDDRDLAQRQMGGRKDICWLAAMLVNAGADLDSFADQLDKQHFKDHTTLLRLLCSANPPPPTVLFDNADLLRATERVMDVMGVDPNTWDEHEMALLHHAVGGDNPEMVGMLVSRGAKIDFRPPGASNSSPVDLARQCGLEEMEQFLFAARAKKTIDETLGRARGSLQPGG